MSGCRRSGISLLGLLATWACQCQPQPEIFPCNSTADCPNNMVCSNGLCREPFDAGIVVDSGHRPDAAGRDLPATDSWWPDAIALDSTDRDGAAAIDGAAVDAATPADRAGESDAPASDGSVDAAAGQDAAAGSDSGAADAAQPVHWWHRDWSWRQRLSFDNTALRESLIDFTVLVHLERSRFAFSHGLLDGSDLRFVASDDETVLDHEIEEWTMVGTDDGIAWIWVRVPRIEDDSSDSFIWLYHGNPSPDVPPAPSDAWSERFRAVYHLGGDSSDSTWHCNDGFDSSTSAASGKIGRGYDFNGVSSSIKVASNPTVDDLFSAATGDEAGGTLLAWVKPRSAGEGSYGRVFDKSGSNNMGGWELETTTMSDCGTAFSFERDYSVRAGDWCAQSALTSYDRWYFVAVVFREDDPLPPVPAFYVDGASATVVTEEAPSGNPLSDCGMDLCIGNRCGASDRTFDGVIDEVRIVKGMLGPDWLAAEFLSMSDAFVTYGPAEQRP